MMELNELTYKIIGAAFNVHKKLGPGLLESMYEVCLIQELKKIGLSVEKQKAFPVMYDDLKLNAVYRVDLIVDGRVVIELKSVAVVIPLHYAQLLTYLKLTGINLGLLLNFKVPDMKLGIKRVINGKIN